VVLLAGAGFVGWRSLVSTGHGSVAVIKMTVQELWQDIQGSPVEAPPAPPQVVPADTVTKTKASVEESLKAPQQAVAANSGLSPPSDENGLPLTPRTSVPSMSPGTTVSGAKIPDTAAKQPVPGAEEVTKANNASDSAAAAAWLWKATAKGNPE
jgi:hypothetical protein